MHTSALNYGKAFFDTYMSNCEGYVVVDIGAQNVNGSLKDVCPANVKYIGVDFVAGNGVDLILDDPYKLPFDSNSIDAVVSSSCFEHSEMFWILFLEMLRILKPHGLIYINVPSNGTFHRYPVDCWRFYPDSGNALVAWAKINNYAPMLLESFIGNQDNSPQGDGFWNDFIAVFVKDGTQENHYPNRIINTIDNFTNAFSGNSIDLLNESNYSEDQKNISCLNQVILLRDTQIADRDTQIADRDTQIADRDTQIADRDAQIGHLNSWIDGLRDEKAKILSSTSWKIAAPVRWVVEFLQGIFNGSAERKK
jgi:SAM-dependent methyltransferase